jgi:transcriptional regulator with XRE-family HTH domain
VLQNTTKVRLQRSTNPDPVDVHVGARLRVRRNLAGLSQDQLAKALGLTFQQIQKYERGVNRMGASRLFQVARLLSVPVGYFFEQLPTLHNAMPGFSGSAQETPEDMPEKPRDDLLHRKETLDLVRAYYEIEDQVQRRKIFELIRSMADAQKAQSGG